jgi:hypothetical protein
MYRKHKGYSSVVLFCARFLINISLCPWKVNLVEWLKMMVGTKRAEEVVDPYLEVKPTTRALKRALLVSLRCVDPDSDKRPKMSQVVRMLEADEYPLREVPNQCSSWNDFFCLFV